MLQGHPHGTGTASAEGTRSESSWHTTRTGQDAVMAVPQREASSREGLNKSAVCISLDRLNSCKANLPSIRGSERKGSRS